jgi:hypothetical protein
VYDQSTGSADIYTPDDPALAVVFRPALVAWEYDEYGYNFSHSIVPANLTGGTEGCHVYKVEIALALNTGGSRIIEAYFVVRSEMGA